MARARKTSRRTPVRSASVVADLKETLTGEFDDWVVSRSVPDPTDQRALSRYAAALRRLGPIRHAWGVGEDPNRTEPSDTQPQTLFDRSWRDLVRTHASKISPEFAFPVRRAAGLYDYYPPRSRPPHAFAEPFSLPFAYWHESLVKSSIMISAPQIDAGVFFSSVHTLNTPSSPIVTPFKATRTAMAWSGTLITIDPRLHDVAHGSKDVVVWAKGTLGYDYTLAASPGRRWDSQPDAASARVAVMARLIRYDRQTGKLVAAAEEVPGYFATQTRLDATLVPNGTTTVPPSCPKPLVGGPYAAWSTGQDPFYLDLPDGQPRWLRTDSFYYVAVLCAASLEAKGAGPAPEDAASASVSATMHLQLVTLGIRPHDPSTL